MTSKLLKCDVKSLISLSLSLTPRVLAYLKLCEGTLPSIIHMFYLGEFNTRNVVQAAGNVGRGEAESNLARREYNISSVRRHGVWQMFCCPHKKTCLLIFENKSKIRHEKAIIIKNKKRRQWWFSQVECLQFDVIYLTAMPAVEHWKMFNGA